MLQFREFLKSGHAPTLWSSFLYFGFSCAVWVINGAMAPFIRDSFQLTPTQMGMMLSIPIFAGALMRFPLGILAQYIGRKNATLVEMAGIFLAMGYGYLFVHDYGDLLAMGILLGVAGASFGVALSLGSGSFPPRYKGLAMGIVGAGNVGTAVAALLAPALAQKFGWQAVYGFAAVSVAVPAIVMAVFAQEPSDLAAHSSFREHIACLFEKDGWAFSLIYAVTFGGFIGLTTFLPSYFYDQFHVSKVQAGQLTMLAAFLGAHLWWLAVGPLGRREHTHGRAGHHRREHGAVRPGRELAAHHHAAVPGVFCRFRRGQWRPVPAGAPALASDHGRGRLDDWRDRRPGRRPDPQRHGHLAPVHRHLPVGLCGHCGVCRRHAGAAAGDADPLDTDMGRKGRSGTQCLSWRSQPMRSIARAFTRRVDARAARERRSR